jgi:hypothetical protein
MTKEELFERSERIIEAIRSRMASVKPMAGPLRKGDHRLLRLDEASERYPFEFLRSLAQTHGGTEVLVIEGDVVGKVDIDLAWVRKCARAKGKPLPLGLVIDGNVDIDGDVLDVSRGCLNLFVTGSTACDYLHSQDGWIEVLGDLDAKYGICGEYNDGSLRVGGKLLAPYIIAGDHDMPREADCEYIYIEGRNGSEEIAIGKCKGSGWGWGWHYFDESNSFLSAEVWEDEEAFNVDSFFGMVRRGANPFRTN